MKKNLSIFFSILGAAMLFSACSRVDDLPYYEDGKPVTLTADKTAVAPTLADSATGVVRLSWSDPAYSTDPDSYKYVIEMDSAGKNFANKTTKTVTGKMSDSLLGRELNGIMLDRGYALGAAHTLDIRVVSSYGNNNEPYVSNTIQLAVTPFADPSNLVTDNNNVIGSLAIAGNNALTFSWSPSFKGYAGVVTYELEYDSAGKNFTSPQTMAAGNDIYNKPLTVGDVNAMALNEGVVGGTTGKISYRIRASTAQGAVAYSNAVDVTVQTYVPFYRMYLVGAVNGWDINNPLEIISDKNGTRWGKVFYTYVHMNAGDGFLFVQTPGDWNSKYGSASSAGTTHTLAAQGGGSDFIAPATGIYRVTLDLNTNQAYVQPKQVGLVGSLQGWDPSSPLYGGLIKRDHFLILASSAATDEFKFHDGPAWDNSAPDLARWWGIGANAGELDIDGNGGNIPTNAATRVRAIWDGTDPQQVKYEVYAADEMRLVGDGIDEPGVNDWDPPTSPQMTYQGNGVWTITVNLKANKDFKFLAGNAWGAFDYEDASGGDQSTGTARAIQWHTGPNFKTPATAGSYTITLNEYTQTVTVN